MKSSFNMETGQAEYKGAVDVIAKIIKNEGFFSLWKGDFKSLSISISSNCALSDVISFFSARFHPLLLPTWAPHGPNLHLPGAAKQGL